MKVSFQTKAMLTPNPKDLGTAEKFALLDAVLGAMTGREISDWCSEGDMVVHLRENITDDPENL